MEVMVGILALLLSITEACGNRWHLVYGRGQIWLSSEGGMLSGDATCSK